MIIYLNIDPLKVFTTGKPVRGMLPFLLALRPDDHFVLGLKAGTQNDENIRELLAGLVTFSNWELFVEKRSTRLTNLLCLIGHPDYNRSSVQADIYINFDAGDLGRKNRPLICLLADLSVVKVGLKSSHNLPGRIIRKRLFKRAAKFADEIIVISENTKSDLEGTFPKSIAKLSLIYNGIDDEWFSKVSKTVSTKNHESFWIWWGYVSPRKNLTSLIEAYKQAILLDNKIPNLVLVASGPVDDLIQLIEQEGLIDKVKLEKPKQLEDLIDRVDQSCGLIFPSYYEGFGLPVVEAMARGKDVLCANNSSLVEISGNLGHYFSPYSIDEIVSCLVSWRESLNERKLDQLKAWSKRFTHERCAEQYNEILTAYAEKLKNTKP